MEDLKVVETEIMSSISFRERLQLLKKFFFERGEKYPPQKLPQQSIVPSELFKEDKGIKTVWLGHSSLFMNVDGVSILTDPVFEKKISIVGPWRFNSELPLDIAAIDHIDLVIISHNHYDHLNKFTVKFLKGRVGTFLVPFGVGGLLRRWGVPEQKIVELEWWQSYSFTNNLVVTATPSQHFSGRGVLDRNSSLWASWVIQSSDNAIFFSGDSGYFDGFTEIGRKYGPFDVTFLECGAYNENWSQVHMFPEETVQAFLDLQGKILQPIHWATYNLSLHPWYEPIERLVRESNKHEITLTTPLMGDIIDYQNFQATNYWWRPFITKNIKTLESGIDSEVVLRSD